MMIKFTHYGKPPYRGYDDKRAILLIRFRSNEGRVQEELSAFFSLDGIDNPGRDR